MAKKDKVVAEGSESGGSRVVTALIALVIVLIWLAVFGFLIKLDVGGIGSEILYPVLKDVPVVNKILPEVSEERQAEEGNYQYTTLKSANARIKELESQLASASGTTTANSDYISELEAEVTKLKRYKDDQDAFEKRVQEFDEKVVSEYKAYYDEINPENAEKLYKQVVTDLEYSAKTQELASYYSKMEPASAARTLSEMAEDLNLVCDIIEHMGEKQAAAIETRLPRVIVSAISSRTIFVTLSKSFINANLPTGDTATVFLFGGILPLTVTLFFRNIVHNIPVVAIQGVAYLIQDIQHNRLVTAQLGHSVR